MEFSKAALHTDGSKCFNEKAITFQEKILNASCISDKSLFPEAMRQATLDGKDAELKSLNMQCARTEAENIVFNVVEQVLESTNTKPQDIDILIVNCSLFCPTPSLSAMIVNKFKFRSDILSYNLGGMGCSASPISIWYELEIVAELGNTCGTERPDGVVPPTSRRLMRGDCIWQIAFGSGFKCNSAVWQALKDH